MAEYIHKQDLIKNIVNTPISWDYPVTSEHLTGAAKRQNEILTLIDDMPTADVRENKRGHWTATPTGDYRCSECGYFTVDLVCVEDGEEGWTEIAPNYCSRCGAEMSL